MRSIAPALLALTLAATAASAPPDPIPDETAVERAEKLIRDVHQAEYAKKKPADLVDLARKLLKEADDTANDPGAKFVLYREARDLAARGGDVPLALNAVAATARAFAVKTDDLTYATLDAAERAKVAPGRAVVEAVLDAADEAVRADNYPAADRFLKLAGTAVGRASSMGPVVAARAKEVEAIRTAFEATAADRDAVQAGKADAAAIGRVGRFLCLAKGDWEAGLPLLAKSDDEKLKAVADLELAKPATGDGKAAVADRWWDLSGGLAGVEKSEARVRAHHWYQEAADLLSGLSKARVDKRLTEVEKAEPKVARSGGWVVLFRSADPSIWNTSGKGKDDFAVPLTKAPAGIRYLRLANTEYRGYYVIIEMTKDRLGKKSIRDGWGWNGTGERAYGAYHLGIYTTDPRREQGTVAINWSLGRDPSVPGPGDYTGCGFGHLTFANNAQGYAWNEAPAAKTVFEIAVTSAGLSAEEAKHFRKKK